MDELSTLKAAIQDAAPKLAAALDALRIAGRAVNDLGALASLLHRDAQDAEAMGDTLAPPLRAFLDGSFLQRSASVNDQSARFVEACRRLAEGVRNLASDGEKMTALIANPSGNQPLAADAPVFTVISKAELRHLHERLAAAEAVSNGAKKDAP